MRNRFTPEQIKSLSDELAELRAKNFDIGDVSENMKKLVNEVYGDEDWSTSGYWVRAQDIVNKASRYI